MPNDLLSFARNVTSQHGEDGIIERIFQIIGEGEKWCVELGALNGTHDSNVWHLVKEKGWSGVLIEADKTQFERLQKEYAGIDRAHCISAFVSFEGEDALDRVFARTPLPKDFDLFSLDIDGNEYHVWESLADYRPRVVVVEFNQTIPNDVTFIQPRDMRVFQGTSLRAFIELGKRKGYELVAANEVNAFFVRKELFLKCGITDNSIDALHTDRQYQTKLFQLYDGTLRISGYDRLLWHNLPIDIEKLQVLPRRARRYPAHIDENSAVRTFKYWARKLPFYPFVQRMRKLRMQSVWK
ncbi:MAG: iron ion binding protein [Parcubacteria group bacterium Gr01-1014_49]|nr:MAG: iron ion binding protein [Parcubacteria group bacterium Gr01-1014_49]